MLLGAAVLNPESQYVILELTSRDVVMGNRKPASSVLIEQAVKDQTSNIFLLNLVSLLVL